MVIDLTLGFNEIDLFAIRYNELRGIVDRFVIVEATHTHSGISKPLYFSEWADKLAPFVQEDVEIIVWNNGSEFAPCTAEYAWLRENYQREILGHWILENCTHDDICILSDMDEIPRADALKQFIASEEWSGVWRFDQVLSYLYLNTTAGGWGGSKLFHARELFDMHEMRIFPIREVLRPKIDRPMTTAIRYRHEAGIAGVIPNGGWHFSSCGGVAKVNTKMESFAHTECAHFANGRIEESFRDLVDPFNKQKLNVVDVATLPQYVQDNIDYFIQRGYIWVKQP